MPDKRSALRGRIIRITSWMIPPIFACAAALVHFQFHVPRSAMVPRAKEEKPKPRSPKKKPPPKPSWQPREQPELDALRVRWEKQPIADEPDDPEFRRLHDSLLRAVAQVAREAALEQRPTSLRVTPKCHTIRCELELCGPSSAVDAIAGVLPKVERKDGPLWHELREVEPNPEAEPIEPDADAPEVERRSCRAWVVGFVVDGSKRGDLQVDGYEPTPKKKPTTEPSARKLEPRDSTKPQAEPG